MYIFIMYGVLLLVPVALSLFIRKKNQGIVGYFCTVILSTALMSGTVIGFWLWSDWSLENKVKVLDRNGDGVWSPQEEATWSSEEKEILQAHMGDGGQSVFAAIVFPIFSIIYSLVLVGSYWAIANISNRRKNA